MPNTFIDELNRLNAQNFLNGLAKGAEAIKDLRQNQRLAELYEKFKIEKNELTPRQEQIEELNKTITPDDIKNDPIARITDYTQKMSVNLQKLLQQKNAYSNLYSQYITAFAQLGDEGLRIANTLSKELSEKQQLIDEQYRIPIELLKYQNTLLQQAQFYQQYIEGNIKIDTLKKDAEAKDLFMKFMSYEPVAEVISKVMTLDEATGKTNFTLDKYYKPLFDIYGKNPDGSPNESFMKAWLLLNDYVKSQLKVVDSSKLLKYSLESAQNMAAKVYTMANIYDNALRLAKRYSEITTDPKYAEVRRQYYDAMGADEKTDLRNVQLGSDPQVIENMPDGYAKEQMKWIYTHFYDDTNKDTYYWDYVKMIENELSTQYGKPVRINYDSEINYGGLKISGKNLVLNYKGWWNPGFMNPEVGSKEHMDNIIREKMKEMKTKQNVEEKAKMYQQNLKLMR